MYSKFLVGFSEMQIKIYQKRFEPTGGIITSKIYVQDGEKKTGSMEDKETWETSVSSIILQW